MKTKSAVPAAAAKRSRSEAKVRGVVYGDPERTKRLLLEASVKEFAEHGFGGARFDRIAAAAKINKQALYYHFGAKDELFEAVLEHSYQRFRDGYVTLQLVGLPPEEQLRTLVNNLYDQVVAHRQIFSVLLDENRMQGRHLPNVRVHETANVLVEAIDSILKAGQADGRFRRDLDPRHLWMSILALCIFNVTHSYTLENILGWNFLDPGVLAERKAHVIHLIMSAVVLDHGDRQAPNSRTR